MSDGQVGGKFKREPLTPPKQKRLEKTFEHATKLIAGESPDYDYVSSLLEQCLLGDPRSMVYAEAFVKNLQKKYNNNRSGASFAQFKERGSRAAVKKSLSQGDWDDVIYHGLKVLAVNPWDVPTLSAMGQASGKSGDFDNELYYLKCALIAAPEDPEVNKLCALAMEERMQFDQAIACWHRVEKARPSDDEPKRAISVLQTKKMRKMAGYEDEETEALRALAAGKGKPGAADAELSLEKKLQQQIAADPKKIPVYMELAQYYFSKELYAKAEEVMKSAYENSNEDPEVFEKWQDAQLRRLRAALRKETDPAKKEDIQKKYFQVDLEIWAKRCERFPNILNFKYELGIRYYQAKDYQAAIRELQLARNDPSKKGECLVALGQCFAQIKQYRLAMSHFEMALEEIPDREVENRKKALYLAGKLTLGLKEYVLAEKHLTELAGLDFAYKDVSKLLDKITQIRKNDQSGDQQPPPE